MNKPKLIVQFEVAKECGQHVGSNLYADFAIDTKVNVLSAFEKGIFVHTLCIGGLSLDELTAITALLKAHKHHLLENPTEPP